MTRFTNRSAIITGAASGIGWACAERLLSEGATVVLCDLDATKAQELLAGWQAKGHDARGSFVLSLDVADPEAVAQTFAAIFARAPQADILINSAGIREIVPPLELQPDMWGKVLDVNLSGTFYTAQALARHLVAQGRGGAVVNVASTAGLVPSRSRAAYVASKHGVVGLSKQMAYEFGQNGIRVNAVAPSITRTPMTESYFADPLREAEILLNFPLGRVGRPEDVAAAIAFLASDDASFITGAILPVDGGNIAGKR